MYFCHPWVIFDSFVHKNFLDPWLFGGRGRNRRDTWTDRLFKGNIIFDTRLYWIISSFSLQAHRRRNVIVLTKRCSRLQLSEKDNFVVTAIDGFTSQNEWKISCKELSILKRKFGFGIECIFPNADQTFAQGFLHPNT